ncbi:MAG: hypothetical protein A3E59_01870 [Candidatus Zambryskibacteria bacterium RIFCSPHIGHO2_12_FULL_39_47]|nr:MAG: hypothetical protein A3E59_01870 [Candidatus Zambryskibacteria bacterium RIFCSPHIGHO2_12_FULL_39_47]
MTKVVPAIIPQTRRQLTEEIKKVSGFADLVQIDISDGLFTPIKTWPYNGRDQDFFEKLKKGEEGWPEWDKVDFEIHLMVRNPEDVVADWIKTGVVALVVHIESTNHFQKVVGTCRLASVSLGVAIKPSTNIDLITPLITQVDFIQVMGNDHLGKHGMELDFKAVELIKSLRKLYPERTIAIDIGVNTDTVETLVSAGANKLISGSEILDADNPKEVYKYFKSIGK